MPRFFVENGTPLDGQIVITGEDAHHISYSLRMAVGDPVTVCDMARTEYECVIEAFSSEAVTLKILSQKESRNEPPHFITLYQAMPKGDKFDTIIQKAVETGVSSIVPFYSERCVVKAKESTADKKQARRNKISLEAAKQCGRAAVIPVRDPLDFASAIKEASRASLPLFCYEGDGAIPLKQLIRSRDSKIGDISIVIGSEGGFSQKEAEYAGECGMLTVNLGPRILRCETASGFVLSALAYEFEL
ncbi:MAG: 16S rRNA (uracil(1498)-N(3))-methyltransferase [Clostridia bacterium]|nr:16S rRNA (uracil(1498)-N(3))-methyltransferase [Clostridia bacterium]